MSTPNDTPAPQWQRITPENQPQFPCWLWDGTSHPFAARRYTEPAHDLGLKTHWHPDQPTEPAGEPEPVIGSMSFAETIARARGHQGPPQKPTPFAQTKPHAQLLGGMEPLLNPDYHALNDKGERLLHAVLCAYAKHHMGRDEIGWEQLSEILCNAICEEIGDDEYVKWSNRL